MFSRTNIYRVTLLRQKSATGQALFQRFCEENERRRRRRRRLAKGRRPRYSARSAGCTKRIQFDGITITGVMSENNEISPNHHGSPGIRSFVRTFPSLFFPVSSPFRPSLSFLFFPLSFLSWISRRLYYMHTRPHMNGHVQGGPRKMSRNSNQSRSRVISLPIARTKVERSSASTSVLQEADFQVCECCVTRLTFKKKFQCAIRSCLEILRVYIRRLNFNTSIFLG